MIAIMQQLTLQFEGFADEMRQPETQGTAKVCQKVFKACELSFGWAMKQSNAVAAVCKVGANLKLYVQGVLVVAFGFGLMFFSAIIGG